MAAREGEVYAKDLAFEILGFFLESGGGLYPGGGMWEGAWGMGLIIGILRYV